MKRLIVLALLAAPIFAQAPDCIVFFALKNVGDSQPTSPNAGYNNIRNGCTTWNLTYSNNGFSAITLALQSAPNAGATPGTWITFSGGTLVQGVNPNTATAQAFTWITGYNPWIRVRLTAATGTGEVDGALYGYRIPLAGAAANTNLTQVGGANITLGQKVMATSLPVVLPSDQSAVPVSGSVTGAVAGTTAASGALAGVKPVYIGGSGGSPGGAALYPISACDNPGGPVPFTVTAGTTGIVIINTATLTTRVCAIAMTATAASTATLSYGTGTTCGTGNHAISGALTLATGVPFTLGSGLGEIFRGSASNDICLAATGGNVTGFLTYTQY